MTDATLDQIIQSDALVRSWLGHIPKLILQVVDLVLCLNASLKLLDNLSEEHIDHKSVNGALMVNI